MSNKIFKDLRKRLVVSAITISIIGVMIELSQNVFFKPVFVLLLTFFLSVCIYEYIKMVEHKNIFLNKKIIFISAFLEILSFYISSQSVGLSFLPIYTFFFIICLMFVSRFNKIEGSMADIVFSIFSILYIAIPIGFLF